MLSRKLQPRRSLNRVPLSSGAAQGVDRQNRVLRGYVVALAGPFKSEGRGEFDQTSLSQIVQLWPTGGAGLRSRWSHPDESHDGLGRGLGRARNPRLSSATVERDDRAVQLPCVRADLHFFKVASRAPEGDLAGYVMDLAAEDPNAISSSLVLQKNDEYRMGPDGHLEADTEGEPLPPLWRVTKLMASDIVGEGDAVDGILGALPNAALWTGARLLRQALAVVGPDGLSGALEDLLAGRRPRGVSADLARQAAEVLRSAPFAGRADAAVKARAWLGRALERESSAGGARPGVLRRRLNLKLKERQSCPS